ncbi:MAG: WYL domain-containing protein [Bacteroidales bacterium]|nr:WYL domain-containing protein [Bacteroidales bacterium]
MRKSSTAYLFECYIWLVNTIAHGPISREAIDEKWARASVNDYKTDSIPESTFHRWRNTVELLFDIEIKCNAHGEYYIEETESFRRTDLRSRIFNLLSINNLLKDCQELRKYILFEPMADGEEHLPTIIEALRDKHVLNIYYQNFSSLKPIPYEVEPYCLKMYRQRWYLIAFARNRGGIRHFALDRVVTILPTQVLYNIPEKFDADEYFKNVCGVTILKDKPEEIIISVSAPQVPYFRTLPLHHSQKEIEVGRYESKFSYYLIPTEEFIRELRAYGIDVVVRSPDWLCQQFRADNKVLYNVYKKISPE